MHTVLGAGGPVANALTNQLINTNETVRLVSRRPVSLTAKNITWKKADLLNYHEVAEAAKGSTVIYLCAGLLYDKTVWQQQWPVIMQNVINVAKENRARLIFFDNVYMYGLVNGPMTESTPYNPTSKKGEIRAAIATQLMDEVKAGNIQASIARAADFYGAESKNSFVDMLVIDKYAKKQKAQWLGDPACKHNFTYVPDAGKAMALLGRRPDSDNQIWHMPTPPAVAGKEIIQIAANIFEVEPRYIAFNRFMLQLAGLFSKTIANTVEMYYQCNHDYIFDSSKFEKAFNFKPTDYQDGIKLLSETLYGK